MITQAPVIAAIDVGTNSIHLIIASADKRGVLQIHSREKESVRLGSSMSDMKYLKPDAIERGVRVLKYYSELAKVHNAEIIAVATSAVREAENKKEFLDRVRDETGIDVKVISGDEEGRLIYVGVIHALPISAQKTLVIDIGGGSTETIIGQDEKIVFVKSEKLGAIRLTKRFFTSEKVKKEQIQFCREFIKGEWAPTLKRIKEIGFETVVGTSGTIQNIAVIALSLLGKAIPEILNGLVVTNEEILFAIEKLIATPTTKKRAEIPGIDPTRADIIVAGALILEHIINTLKIEKLIISSYALREGIVFDYLEKKKDTRTQTPLDRLKHSAVYSLCNQYKVDLKHSEYVKKIALKIFDALQPLHHLGPHERELLEVASLLHDVGYIISHDQHHKHSYYILSNCIIPGYTNTETEIIANIARYHRKSHPKKKHLNFIQLSPENQRIVKILASILRIAEGIDRRQMQNIKDVIIKIKNGEIEFELIPDPNNETPDIEIWGADRRKLLMEETFNKKVSFVVRNNNHNS